MPMYSAFHYLSLACLVFKFTSSPLISFLYRLGYGNPKADIALGLVQVILELLELLLFQRSGEVSLLVVVGEHSFAWS